MGLIFNNMRSEEWMSILGIEGTNSNGHEEGKDENLNIVETIRNL
jgi:hypothetical protein